MAIIGEAQSGVYSRADVDRKRRLAEMLMKDDFQAREPFGALAKGLTGARAGFEDKQASEGERQGNQIMADLLKSQDWQGVMGSEWATPQNLAMASMLQGREWNQQDQQANWAREDAIRAAEAGKPSGYRPMTAEEKAAYGLPQDAPAQISADGKVDTIGGGGVNVDARNMGGIPPGYKVDYDEQGNPVSMSPIPGSPAALEAAAAAAKADQADQNTNQGAGIVVEDVGRAIDKIKKDPMLTTGFIGSILSGIGGTPAGDVSSLVKTIKANSAFDQLQAMRAASPTGGALGAVSDTEMGLLQSAIGNLEQSQSDDQLIYNLRRVQKLYSDIVNGPNAPASGGGEDDIDAILGGYGL